MKPSNWIDTLARRPLPHALLLILIAVLVTTGCETKTSDRDLAMVAASEVEALLGPREAVLGIGGSEGGVLVDARSASEYRAGHIPGAVSIPYGSVQQRHGELVGYSVVIVYGDDYNSPIALGMSKTLIELGLPDVRTLRGGLRAWEDSGRPVEDGR